MREGIKIGIILCGAFIIGFLSFGLPTWRDRFVFGGTCIFVFTIMIIVLYERIRRVIEGYYAYTSGGAEEGVLIYNEGGKILQLYFSRIQDTIYVPSDTKWKEVMPDWAKERKHEIVSRMKRRVGKRLVGKGWTYQESDQEEHLIGQR